jgi:uncharacterized protein
MKGVKAGPMPGSFSDRIPDEHECRELIKEYGMLPNILKHSEQVMRVSLCIADNLKKRDAVKRDLILAAALLHDITKTRSIGTGERHDVSGGELLRGLGFESVAVAVEQHVEFRDFRRDGPLLEKEIIYYADKRVMHDVIVTLDERLEDLVKRYGITSDLVERILSNKGFLFALEEKIASHMATGIHDAIDSLR